MNNTTTEVRPNICMEPCENPTYATFHTRTKFGDYSSDFDFGDRFKKLTEQQRHLAARILGINGVCTVSFRHYQFTVSKGAAFDWSELRPGIEAAYGDYAGTVAKVQP